MDISATGLLRKRQALFASRPAIYVLIVVFAVVAASAYKLRAEGIFSCQADGYIFDRYLAYCNGAKFGDYEHGAFWFDLEPSVKKFANGADVVFLGDSHIQFGFSTDATDRWFSSASLRYYLLGFIYGERKCFTNEILRNHKPGAKVYVIAVDFFERTETSPAKDVMRDPASRYRYDAKYIWELVHRQICEKLSAICGRKYAIFRSRETGAYYKSGKAGVEDILVQYDHDINERKIKDYTASARSFLSQWPIRSDCVILTTVPTVRAHAFVYSPSIETAEAVAKGLGVTFVPAALDGLRTFDGSHLTQSSAERWSKAFFEVAGPQILEVHERAVSNEPMKMNWLPIAPDFNGDLRAALKSASSEHYLEKLTSLAQYRLDFLETLQLDKALGRLTLESVSSSPPVRLAILASSTVDHLSPAIRVGGLRRRILIDVHTGTYGQYRQDLLESTSPLYQFAPQTIIFSLTARDTIASIPLTATAAEVDEIVGRSVDGLRFLWRKARDTFKATIIQQTFLDITEPIFGSHDRLVPGAPARVIAKLNDRLSEAAARDAVIVLDIAGASARDGIDKWFEVGHWLRNKMEIAPPAVALFGDMVARIVAAERGLSKKCLVLDLDNTLWGGVVGDDGLEGIVLGEGSAAGEAHLALQRYAKQLNERGVILAVCSKNDPTIAEAAFRDHPEMYLRCSDIAAFVANWDDKSENLKRIAAQLNIGIDSLVFVDDSPVERARVRQSLPAVSVPELPDDVANYVRCLADAGYFEAIAFTSEDRQRAAQYAANTEREALRSSSQSMDDFLRSLRMTVSWGPFSPVDLARITQLINKTNQFNTTTRRYSSEQIARFATAADVVTLQFRLRDRFTDNGLVSTMILRPDSAQPESLTIDNWVMSCRVFGRQLEFEAMNIVVEKVRRCGVRTIHAEYIPTAKNKVINELFSSLGFNRVNDSTLTNGATRWTLNLSEYIKRETHIARTGAVK